MVKIKKNLLIVSVVAAAMLSLVQIVPVMAAGAAGSALIPQQAFEQKTTPLPRWSIKTYAVPCEPDEAASDVIVLWHDPTVRAMLHGEAQRFRVTHYVGRRDAAEYQVYLQADYDPEITVLPETLRIANQDGEVQLPASAVNYVHETHNELDTQKLTCRLGTMTYTVGDYFIVQYDVMVPPVSKTGHYPSLRTWVATDRAMINNQRTEDVTFEVVDTTANYLLGVMLILVLAASWWKCPEDPSCFSRWKPV